MLALKTLARRKIRTALTTIGVAAGVATVVALSAITSGVHAQLNSMFDVGEGYLVVTSKGAVDPLMSYVPDGLIAELEATDGVAAAHPLLWGATMVADNPFFFSFGVDEGSPFLTNVRTVEGRGLFDATNPADAIMLGRQAADYMEVAVGDELDLARGTYEVVGIFESATPLIGGGGLLPFARAQVEASLEGKMSMALVRFEDADPRRLAEHEAFIEERFQHLEGTLPGGFTGAFDEYAMMDEMVFVISLIAVIIGGIAVMNTMLMSVFERTRELGVLQAVGWSRWMVLRLVLAESLLVCLLAGPLGIVVGVGGIELLSSSGGYTWLSAEYRPQLVVRAFAVGLGMGLVGSVYPAWRAVHIPPIEALRYE